jgi:hypothetical protein
MEKLAGARQGKHPQRHWSRHSHMSALVVVMSLVYIKKKAKKT